jgi:hypothetical protein
MHRPQIFKTMAKLHKPLQVAAVMVLTFNSGAFAKSKDFIMDTSDVGKTTGTIVSSDQFMEIGTTSASTLRMEGEQALRMGSLDRALTVLQRSVEMGPLDMDSRILYAEALEKKLMAQKEKDPVLYNFLVKQWLFILKQSEFPDQGVQGYQHLQILTGTLPKRWEKVPKFLSRVLIPEDGSVKVALGGKHAPAEKEDETDEK